jgi:hypothetical protein
MGRLSMHSKCLDFYFLLSLWGLGGGGDFFHFSFVLNMFLSSSQWSPIRFPKCTLCSQECSQWHLTLIPYVLPEVLPPLTYLGGPKGEALHLSMKSSILGSLHSFNFFWTREVGSWVIHIWYENCQPADSMCFHVFTITPQSEAVFLKQHYFG